MAAMRGQSRPYAILGELRQMFDVKTLDAADDRMLTADTLRGIRQYFFAGDRDEMPFNRSTRGWVYRLAKNEGGIIGYRQCSNH